MYRASGAACCVPGQHSQTLATTAGNEKDTLQDVMVRMSAAEVHRIFLCDRAGKLQRVVSLGDILATFKEAVEVK